MINLQTIDLKLLRIFDTIVRYGGFSAAQAALNIGQSSISEQMSQLEVRLGVKLCDRGRSGFRLTDQGLAIHRATEKLLAAADRFGQDAEAAKNSIDGQLTFGIIDNTITDPAAPISKATKKFVARNHDVYLSLYVGSPAELEARVLDARLQFAIGHFPFKVAGLTYSPLYEEVHGLYCGRAHPLFSSTTTDRDLCENAMQFRIVARGYMQSRELRVLRAKTATATVDNIEAQALLILSGAYIGFLPCHFAMRWTSTGELRHLAPRKLILRSPFEIISQKGKNLPLVAKVFLEDLESVR